MMTLTVQSRHQHEMIEISDQVQSAIARSGIQNGLALVFTPHTTAAVTINENADPDVVTDMLHGLGRLVPLQDNYRHLEGNSAAHIKSSLIGAGETLIVADGTAVLGTWQGIYFCEFDGPRTRKVFVRIMAA